MQNYSVARLAARVRELPVALAQTFVRTRPDSPRVATLNRLYAQLDPVDQLRCRAELFECREARRGQRLASAGIQRRQALGDTPCYT